MYFKVGPELYEGGYGNFVIQFQKNSVPFYDLILIDSLAEREEFTAAEGRYDYIKASQVEWYESKVANSAVNNLVFMHIPLRQWLNTKYFVFLCLSHFDYPLLLIIIPKNILEF